MEKIQTYPFTVTIVPPATSYGPVDGRKYTLSNMKLDHSRVITIGNKYNINTEREGNEDILTAEWMPKLGEYVLSGRVYVSGGEFDEEAALQRMMLFQNEIPGMIDAIINSDYDLYQHVPWLLDASIYIQFDSHFPELRSIQGYGTPRSYLNLHF